MTHALFSPDLVGPLVALLSLVCLAFALGYAAKPFLTRAKPPAPPPTETTIASILADDGPYRSAAPAPDTPLPELLDQIQRLQAENALLRTEVTAAHAKINAHGPPTAPLLLWMLAGQAIRLVEGGLHWKDQGVTLKWHKDLGLYTVVHSGKTIASPVLNHTFLTKVAKIAPFKDWK
jgi:hypothetical protein